MSPVANRFAHWLPMMLGALLVGVLWAIPAVGSGSAGPIWPSGDADRALATLQQSVLPELDARRASADARAAAIQAFLDGAGELAGALPDLAGRPLQEAAILDARLARLDAAGEQRAAERIATPPPVDPSWQAKATAALTATHEAEERATALERRVLLGLRGWLRNHPSLQGGALTVHRAALRAEIEAARALAADDPGRAAALAAADGAAGDLIALDALLASLRRVALVPGAPPPDLTSDLAALDGPRADAAAFRLALATAASPDRTDVAPRLAEWVAEQVAEIEARALPAPADLPADPAAQVAAAKAAHASAPAALQPLFAARTAWAERVLDVARENEAAAKAIDNSDATRVEAAVERETQDSASALTAILIEARAPAQDRVRRLREDLDKRTAVVDGTRAEATATLATADDLMTRLRSPETRRSEIDEVYATLRTLLRELRESARAYGVALALMESERTAGLDRIAQERARIASERKVLAEITDVSVQERRREALDKWAAVLDDEKALLARRAELYAEARDLALQTVDQAAPLRRTLSARVSASEADEDAMVRLTEAYDELSGMGPAFMAIQRGRFNGIQIGGWGWFQALRDLLLGSLAFIAAAIFWWVARRYSGSLVGVALDRMARWRDWRRGDLTTVEEPLRRTLVTLIDVAAAWALFLLQPDGLPEISVVLVLFFELQVVRLELSIFDLLVSKSGERRPTVVRLGEGGRRAARVVVLVLGLWLGTRRVLLSFAHDALHGFATEFLVGAATWLVLALLVLFLLYMLAPHVRGRIGQRRRDTRLSRLLTVKPPLGLGGIQALAGLGFILFSGLRSLWFRVARGGVGGPMLAALERLRVGRAPAADPETEPDPLSAELTQLLSEKASERAFQDRPKARKALVTAVKAWNKERSQGLIAFLGDIGEGRHTALEHWKGDWEALGLTTTWVTLDRRLATERDAFVWLAHAFELSSVPTTVEEAAQSIGARLDPGVYVLNGMHLSFLRTVGGFDALRTLLDVLHADGEVRCWILAAYRPAWRYLERLGSGLNVQLVRCVVDLPALDAEQLRKMTEKLVGEVGYTLDFGKLAATGAFAAEHEVELQRAVETYYRVLAVSSAGNPSVALDLWKTCLSEGPDKTLLVHMSDSVRGVQLPELSDDHLFLLAAVRTQGEVDAGELAEVLNIGIGKVRALVRQMVAGGLLTRSEHGVYVARPQLPAVTQTLRRRHFVHWS